MTPNPTLLKRTGAKRQLNVDFTDLAAEERNSADQINTASKNKLQNAHFCRRSISEGMRGGPWIISEHFILNAGNGTWKPLQGKAMVLGHYD